MGDAPSLLWETFAQGVVNFRLSKQLAEPYLERLYGEEYRLYKSRTGRWIFQYQSKGINKLNVA